MMQRSIQILDLARCCRLGAYAKSKDTREGSILWEDEPKKSKTNVLSPAPSIDQMDFEQIQALQRKQDQSSQMA
jgi:hypothetical protein